jgi:thioredoxin reductase
MEIEKVAIVGAGPAGVATAIQLQRYGITPLLFEKGEVGGLLRNANLVENYPGFPGGISGIELAKRVGRHLQDTAIQPIPEMVINIDFEGDTFRIATPRRRYDTQVLVVASGTKPIKPASPVISPCVQPHVYFEVAQLCHVTGKKIVIIGAGDAAFDYALNLSHQNEVVIINRGTAVKCIPLLWNRAQAVPMISYHSEVAITRILEAGEEDPLNHVCVYSENGLKFRADIVIFAIGREPQLDFISDNLKQRQAELIADGKLYFVGDVKNEIFRQTAISVGDGVLAAMKINRSLLSENGRHW